MFSFGLLFLLVFEFVFGVHTLWSKLLGMI